MRGPVGVHARIAEGLGGAMSWGLDWRRAPDCLRSSFIGSLAGAAGYQEATGLGAVPTYLVSKSARSALGNRRF